MDHARTTLHDIWTVDLDASSSFARSSARVAMAWGRAAAKSSIDHDQRRVRAHGARVRSSTRYVRAKASLSAEGGRARSEEALAHDTHSGSSYSARVRIPRMTYGGDGAGASRADE